MILILDDPGAMPSCSKPWKVPSKGLYTWELLGGFGLPGEEEEMGPTDIDYLTHFRQAQVTFETTAFSVIGRSGKI
jgi:hypothetical protein